MLAFYTGKERDSESGLDNFGARYNSSQLGRFMSPDPSGLALADPVDPQQLNLYVYVRDNPLVLTDPFGLDCVYLNDAGDGVQEVDHASGDYAGAEQNCWDTGGTWLDGYVDPNNVVIDPNSNWVGLFGSNNQITEVGCSGTSDQCGGDALTSFLSPSTTVVVNGNSNPDQPFTAAQSQVLSGVEKDTYMFNKIVSCASAGAAAALGDPSDPEKAAKDKLKGAGRDLAKKAFEKASDPAVVAKQGEKMRKRLGPEIAEYGPEVGSLAAKGIGVFGVGIASVQAARAAHTCWQHF